MQRLVGIMQKSFTPIHLISPEGREGSLSCYAYDILVLQIHYNSYLNVMTITIIHG